MKYQETGDNYVMKNFRVLRSYSDIYDDQMRGRDMITCNMYGERKIRLPAAHVCEA